MPAAAANINSGRSSISSVNFFEGAAPQFGGFVGDRFAGFGGAVAHTIHDALQRLVHEIADFPRRSRYFMAGAGGKTAQPLFQIADQFFDGCDFFCGR
jgi:hypothetical protein